jgi:hypothetical protein
VAAEPVALGQAFARLETYEHARGMEIVRDGSLNCGDKIVCA